MKVRDSGILA